MTRVLVTGATGFIGHHLVKQLVSADQEVRCLVRNCSPLQSLRPFDVKFVPGDVTDLESLCQAMKDCDVVYHLAGLTKCLRAEAFDAVNVHGAQRVAAACARQSQPPTLVLVSSLAATGPAPQDRPREVSDLECPVSRYGASKLGGERAAIRFSREVPLSIVRPPIVLGEHDRDGLAMFRSISRMRLHVVPGLVDQPCAFIHATDLALALMAVADKGRRISLSSLDEPSQRQGFYFASHDPAPTYAQLGEWIGQALGLRRVRILHVPVGAVWCVAGVNDATSRFLGKPHILNWDKAREATSGPWCCSSRELQRDTGWQPALSQQERLQQTVDWYRQHRWL